MHHRHAHGPGGRGFQQLMDLIGLQDAPPAGAGRARRGDVRTATLLLLTEQRGAVRRPGAGCGC